MVAMKGRKTKSNDRRKTGKNRKRDERQVDKIVTITTKNTEKMKARR